MTDFLQYLTNASKLFKPSVGILEGLIDKTGTESLLDLGSGGGGGLLWIVSEIQKSHPDLKVNMTDLYPNTKAFEYTKSRGKNFSFSAKPIDARDIPLELEGIRTQFLSLHHFTPTDAVKILQNAVDANRPIAIFEGQERSLPSLLAMIFSPISVLLTTPLIRPFRWGRIIFTYLIPLVPIFVLWDGIISCFRTYSVAEMNDLIKLVKGKERYEWNSGKLKSGPGINLYLTGCPKKQAPIVIKS